MFDKQIGTFIKIISKYDFFDLTCFTIKVVLGLCGRFGHIFRDMITVWYFRSSNGQM